MKKNEVSAKVNRKSSMRGKLFDRGTLSSCPNDEMPHLQ
jgi:hypothetical protein